VFGSGDRESLALKRQVLASPEFRDRAGLVHVADVDVTAHPDRARRFEISEVPAAVFMTADGKILARAEAVSKPSELADLVEAGRQRLARGEWEGSAGEDRGAGVSDADQMKRLVELLAGPDPADRARAAGLLGEAGERAVPHIIVGLGHSHLAVRVGAADLLARLAPSAPGFDPWAAPEQRTRAVGRMREWWDKTGTLPSPGPDATGAALGTEETRSIEEAIATVVSAPMSRGTERTEAMSALVRAGRPALGEVKKKIAECAAAGD
jgi:hypothetical protein